MLLPPCCAFTRCPVIRDPFWSQSIFHFLLSERKIVLLGVYWKHHSPRNDWDAGGIYPQEVRRLISGNYRARQVLCPGDDASRPPGSHQSRGGGLNTRNSGKHM